MLFPFMLEGGLAVYQKNACVGIGQYFMSFDVAKVDAEFRILPPIQTNLLTAEELPSCTRNMLPAKIFCSVRKCVCILGRYACFLQQQH